MRDELARVLVACRGPCAHRLIASCRALGLETVCAFTSAEAEAPWVEEADYDAWIGDGPRAWTDVARIVGAAMDAGCDAVHPGYGPAAAELDLAVAATAANLAVIGIDPSRAAELLDRGRMLERARRVGLAVPPTEEVSPGQDGIEAAARIGVPLIAAAAMGSAEVRVDGYDELPAALARTRLPAVLMHAADAARQVEVVVVAERGGRSFTLGSVVGAGALYTLDPSAALHEVERQAASLAQDLGFVGVGVARFRITADGTPWFVRFRPHLPEALELVEQVHGVDLVAAQHRLTTTGASGWPGPPVARRAGVLVELTAGEGTIERLDLPDGAIPGRSPGEVVAGDDERVLAKLVAAGADPGAAAAAMRGLLDRVQVAGVETNRDALRSLLTR